MHKIPVCRSIHNGYQPSNANKSSRFLETILPHRSERGTPKSITTKSFYFIDQQKLQDLLRGSARFKDLMQRTKTSNL